jgi:hypothetical protein
MIAILQRNKSLLAVLVIITSVVFMANLGAKEVEKETFHTRAERDQLKLLMRAQPGGTNSLFAGSGVCGGCHGHDPNDFAMIDPTNGEDINITDDWSATMMANSAKDPFWRAKVSHEILVNPADQILLEDKCTSCHAPQGRFNAIHEGATTYAMADMTGDSIALDGVACGACHQQLDTMIGFLNSGNLMYDTTKTVYGPYGNPFAGPMQSFIGFDVVYGEHIAKSGLCAACHTLLTNTVDLAGNATGDVFVEQATYHEWLNSSYNTDDITCQKCHIPQIDENVVIAANFQFLAPRRPFGKHHLVGGNTFMLKLMKDNIASLGITSTPRMFDSTIVRTQRLLRDSTLVMTLDETSRTPDTVFYVLNLINKAGHKFPSRIAYVEFVVLDSLGDTLFKTGMLDSDFNLVNRDATFEPHYNIIKDEQQVQIYEMVMGDVNDDPTTVLERAKSQLKDNRLTPLGFTTTHYAYDTTLIAGEALNDPDFNKISAIEGSGADMVHFHIPLGGYAGALNTSARVYYQSVPRKWLDEMFSYNSAAIDTFRNMYNSADHTPSLVGEILLGSIFTIGIEEGKAEILSLFPNPSQLGYVNLKGIDINSIEEITLIDMTGRIVSTDKNMNWFIGRVNLPQQKGTYILCVKTRNGFYTETVIVL